VKPGPLIAASHGSGGSVHRASPAYEYSGDDRRAAFKVVRSNRRDELLATIKIARGAFRAAAAPVPRSSRYHRDGERQENVLVTKMVANTRPLAGIERHHTPRAAVIPNTNQHISGQNKTGLGDRQQISSAVPSATLNSRKESNLIWSPSCVIVPGPKRWDDRWSGSFERES